LTIIWQEKKQSFTVTFHYLCSDDYYSVQDYCYRNMLQIKERDSKLDVSGGLKSSTSQVRIKDCHRNLIQLSFLENQEGKFCEYFYYFNSE